MTRTNDPDIDLSHQVLRQESQKIETRRAIRRLVGSWVLGAVAAWKLLTYPPDGSDWILAMWVGVALLAFGLASFDQVVKILKR